MAEDSASARPLLHGFLARSSRETVIVDCLTANAVAVELLRTSGFSYARTLTRMVRGPNGYPGNPDTLCAILGPNSDEIVLPIGVSFASCFTNEASCSFSGEAAISVADDPSKRIFYGWWIVVVAFLNLFFIVGIIFYGFPLFYPSFVESLGFTRAQVTQGFFLGFLLVGLPLGFLAGALIDRLGARFVILSGVGLVAASLLLMGSMTKFWPIRTSLHHGCTGLRAGWPIANQVLVARWFRERRGQAMGYAYLGLGSVELSPRS